MAHTVKNLPAMWETKVRSLGLENPLEKEMATHSSILAWRIPWMEKSGTPGGHKESDMTEKLTLDISIAYENHTPSCYFSVPCVL